MDAETVDVVETNLADTSYNDTPHTADNCITILTHGGQPYNDTHTRRTHHNVHEEVQKQTIYAKKRKNAN
jgi:hypothetical protein